jgi:hypothetical protein
MEYRKTPQIKMRIVNGIELDDGVDEPDACEWHDSTDEYQPYHKHLYVAAPPRQVWDGEKWINEPNNRPQDGRVCDCEDAPCCGHYDL